MGINFLMIIDPAALAGAPHGAVTPTPWRL
jgi:predicted lysophospholipase L1 biosynthesis ABC-type transport system permease subunit